MVLHHFAVRIQKRLEGKIHSVVNRAKQGRPLTQEDREEEQPGGSRAGFQHPAEDMAQLFSRLHRNPPAAGVAAWSEPQYAGREEVSGSPALA